MEDELFNELLEGVEWMGEHPSGKDRGEMTLDEYHTWLQNQKAKKPSKFKNEKTTEGDDTYDSKAEARRGRELRLMEQAGDISALELQPVYVLQEGFRDSTGTWHHPITYRADFQYRDHGRLVVEDVKGFRTPEFRIKEKLFRHRYPNIDFRLVGIKPSKKRRKAA